MNRAMAGGCMEFADILHALSGIVVVGFGLFLIVLAALIITMPSRAEEFLRGFASSAVTHYTEQGLRLVVGAAVVSFAGSMRHPELFNVFGWLIIVSTAGLLLIPWQWHNRFSTLVMPPVFRHMRLFALGACALGAFILSCVSQVLIS
ncbi:MAG: hypothetical protein J0L64_01670 [Acidobacteria bacterium]|nr:hypothetical protein [Acidobacteriota bacterium]